MYLSQGGYAANITRVCLELFTPFVFADLRWMDGWMDGCILGIICMAFLSTWLSRDCERETLPVDLGLRDAYGDGGGWR